MNVWRGSMHWNCLLCELNWWKMTKSVQNTHSAVDWRINSFWCCLTKKNCVSSLDVHNVSRIHFIGYSTYACMHASVFSWHWRSHNLVEGYKTLKISPLNRIENALFSWNDFESNSTKIELRRAVKFSWEASFHYRKNTSPTNWLLSSNRKINFLRSSIIARWFIS